MPFGGEYSTFIAAGVALVALLVLLATGKRLRQLLEKFRVRRAIKRLGVDVISKMVIPDGMDGHVFIEHVVLNPDHVLVVSVRRYPGAIFAGDNMDMWAQVTDGGSFKFPNPMHEIQAAILAVKSHMPTVDVKGVILFDRDSTFPKGKPPGVIHINEIAKQKRSARRDDVPDLVREAWNKLLALKSSAA